MSKKRKVVKMIGCILLISGVFLLIGTAGSSDLYMISFKDIVIKSVIGIIISTIGYFVIKVATGGGVVND